MNGGSYNYSDNRSRDVNIKDNIINKKIENVDYDDRRKYIDNIDNNIYNTDINNKKIIDERRYINNKENNQYNTNTNDSTDRIRGDQVNNNVNNDIRNTNTRNERIVLRSRPKTLKEKMPGAKSVKLPPSKLEVCDVTVGGH